LEITPKDTAVAEFKVASQNFPNNMAEKHKNITHYIPSSDRGPNQDILDMKHGCRLLTVTFGDTNTKKLRAVSHVPMLKSHFSSIQDHCERLPNTVC